MESLVLTLLAVIVAAAGSLLFARSVEAEVAVAAAASKTTYAGGGAAFGFAITHQFVIAVCGLLVAIGGFIVNWYFKHKADQRSQRLHDMRMELLQRGRRTDTGLDELDEA